MPLSLLLLLLLFTLSTPAALSQHFTKPSSLSLRSNLSQRYLELARPLPSDRLPPTCLLTALRHSFGDTIGRPPVSVTYSPPSDCPPPWSAVTLEMRVESRGEQYDRIVGVWLGGAEILRTSTAEPNEAGIFWTVRKDITRFW